jgi:hypothetical protein
VVARKEEKSGLKKSIKPLEVKETLFYSLYCWWLFSYILVVLYTYSLPLTVKFGLMIHVLLSPQHVSAPLETLIKMFRARWCVRCPPPPLPLRSPRYRITSVPHHTVEFYTHVRIHTHTHTRAYRAEWLAAKGELPDDSRAMQQKMALAWPTSTSGGTMRCYYCMCCACVLCVSAMRMCCTCVVLYVYVCVCMCVFVQQKLALVWSTSASGGTKPCKFGTSSLP